MVFGHDMTPEVRREKYNKTNEYAEELSTLSVGCNRELMNLTELQMMQKQERQKEEKERRRRDDAKVGSCMVRWFLQFA